MRFPWLPLVAALAFSQPAAAAFTDKEIAAVCQHAEADLRDLIESQSGARTGMDMAKQAGLESEVERWQTRYDKMYRSMATISAVYANFDCGKRK